MSDAKASVRRGGCLCGSVRYEVEGSPVVVAHCHCADCQRGTGTGHSTGAMFPADRFRLTGPLGEYRLVSDRGTEVTKAFCPSCGSPLFGRNTGMPHHVTVALGTFDDPSGFEPGVVVYARNRMPWDVMDETLPTFQDQPDWKPDDGA